MELPAWYAIALGGLLTPFFITYLCVLLAVLFRAGTKTCVRRYATHPQLIRVFNYANRVARGDVVVLFLFLLANVIVLSLYVDGLLTFVRRSGLICIVNLMPLFLGGRMNVIADSCRLNLRTVSKIHRWLGRVVILEGFIHVVAALFYRTPTMGHVADRAALASTAIFLVIFFSGLLRPRWYETFFYLHLVLGTGAIATIYLHNPARLFESPTRYLTISVCLQILSSLLQLSHILYRNVRYHKPLSQASVRIILFRRAAMQNCVDTHAGPDATDIPLSDAVHVHVRLSRPWKPHAGQYVYLCMPGASRTSFAQLHPFYIAWWYRDRGDDYAVFIVQNQRGFSGRLFLHRGHALDETPGIKALVEGPYGKQLRLDLYGTVMLFATGIVIAGQLSYVAHLLTEYRNCEVKTRRIALFWEVESEIHTAWVADRMQGLLRDDVDRVLDIHIFVIGDFLLPTETCRGQHKRLGERIDVLYDALSVEDILNHELKQRKGRTVLSLCVHPKMNLLIRRKVQSMAGNSITVKQLDFDPPGGSDQNTSSGSI